MNAPLIVVLHAFGFTPSSGIMERVHAADNNQLDLHFNGRSNFLNVRTIYIRRSPK